MEESNHNSAKCSDFKEGNSTDNKSKKNKLLLIIVVLLLIGVIGVSFAYWMSTTSQKSINKIASECLKVTIEDITDAINLSEVFPISDEEATELVPYTFKVENICNTTASYNINLEVLKSLKEDTNQLSSQYVAVSFDGGSKKILGSLPKAEATYSDDNYQADKAFNLLSNGILAGGKSVEYTIKLWIDESAYGKDIMNQTFLSKISITSGVATQTQTLADQVELGDYISMTPTSTSYTILGSETGCTDSSYCNGVTDQTLNPSELNLWRVISKNEDGTVDVVSEYVSSTDVYFYGPTGVLNYIGVLNKIARQYENNAYTVGSRHMGYNGQTEYLELSKVDFSSQQFVTATDGVGGHGNQYESQGGGDTLYERDINLLQTAFGNDRDSDNNKANKVGETTAAAYWVASRVYSAQSSTGIWKVRHILGHPYSGGFSDSILHYSNMNDNTDQSGAVRPIVTLKSNLTVSGGGKSESDPYVLN